MAGGGSSIHSKVHDPISKSSSKELQLGVPGSQPFKVPSSPSGA